MVTKEATIKNQITKRSRAKRKGFLKFRDLPQLAKSKHFALHASQPVQIAAELVQFDLAFILPKKHAKSSVRRNGIRRKAKALLDLYGKNLVKKDDLISDKSELQGQTTTLQRFTVLIRLRRPVDTVVYKSAWSSKLKSDIHVELSTLFTYLCKPC